MDYATTNDLATLWRPMTPEEMTKAEALIPVVCASLRNAAKMAEIDLNAKILEDDDLALVAKSVTCDVVARALMTSTNQEPLTQFSQSAGGYTVSGSYLVAGGGLFIKKTELARLGIKRQRYGALNIYGCD